MNEFHAVKLQITEGQQIEVSISGFTGPESTALLMSDAQFDAFNKAVHSSDRAPWCEMTQGIQLTPDEPSKVIRPPEAGTWYVVFSNSYACFFRAITIET